MYDGPYESATGLTTTPGITNKPPSHAGAVEDAAHRCGKAAASLEELILTLEERLHSVLASSSPTITAEDAMKRPSHCSLEDDLSKTADHLDRVRRAAQSLIERIAL